jgi:very-short-patch-repair endonuclease
MIDIAAAVISLGGMAQKQQLVRLGARDLDLTRAVRSGSVSRARQGWYTVFTADDPRLRAVRVGGRLTGISAIQALGGWVLGQHPLHVAVQTNAARLRSQWNRHTRLEPRGSGGVVMHWDVDGHDQGTACIVPLMTALRRAVLDEPLDDAIAALDWALHAGLIDDFDVHSLVQSLPADFARLPGFLDAACEALPESLARTRLTLRNHTLLSQVPLTTGERLDLLVDGCVGLETDGERYHANSFERDRLKDLAIAIDGYHGIRVSARTVFGNWPVAEAAIEAALAQHENSGVRPALMRNAPGFARIRRRDRRRSPEFPKGEYGQRGFALASG